MRRFRSSRLSFEAYPLTGITRTDHYLTERTPTSFGMYGAGTRVDWKFTPIFSGTGDFTESAGGPFFMQTVELGTRLHPDRSDRIVQPFVDFRGTWARTTQGLSSGLDGNVIANPFFNSFQRGAGTSYGFGGYAGVGMAYSITRTLAITTSLGMLRSLMSPAINQPAGSSPFHATTARWTLGLKYNPQHLVSDLPGLAVKTIK
jgi:hypothetical protein